MDYRVKLEELLDGSFGKIKKSIEDLLEPGMELVIFGAGRKGQETATALRDLDFPIFAFADNNMALWGTEVDGIPVNSLYDIVKMNENIFVLISIEVYHTDEYIKAEIDEMLETNNCKNSGNIYNDPFLTLLKRRNVSILNVSALEDHKDNLLQVFDLLADDLSKSTFYEYIYSKYYNARYSGTILDRKYVYFNKNLYKFILDEVYADCGANEGDTVLEFIDNYGLDYKKIYAIEPVPQMVGAMHGNFNNLTNDSYKKIQIINKAVSNKEETASFMVKENTRHSMLSKDGDIEVECITLDEICDVPPTLIKVDTEGNELKVLEGAKNTIKANRPVLVISDYHKLNDLWELPLWMQDNCSGYKFFTYYFYSGKIRDLILFGIPEERLA